MLQQDNVLGKVVMVSAIIALTLYHRVAGIVALIVVISIMQQQPQPLLHQQRQLRRRQQHQRRQRLQHQPLQLLRRPPHSGF